MEHEKEIFNDPIVREESGSAEGKEKSVSPARRKKRRKQGGRPRKNNQAPRPRPRKLEQAAIEISDESVVPEPVEKEPAVPIEPDREAEQAEDTSVSMSEPAAEKDVVAEEPVPTEVPEEPAEEELVVEEMPVAEETAAESLDTAEEEPEQEFVPLQNEQVDDEVPQPSVEPEKTSRTLQEPASKQVCGEDDEDAVKKKHHFAFYMGWFTLVFTLCSILLIAALFLFSGNPLFTTADDVELPNFTQMTREEVESNPAYASFKLQFEEEYNSEVEEGVIYDQSPKPPKKVKENSVITLRVSKGTEYVEIPDVSGWKRETAREKLKELGVEVLIRYEESEEDDPDTVLRTDPVAGETVQTGTTVSLYVSQADQSKSSNVPNCVGKTQSEANNLLLPLKLKVKVVTRDSSSPKGTVLSQSPQPGILLQAGDTVTLYVSSGEPEVPDVTETGHVHSWSPPDENGYQFCYVCLQTRKAPE